jgi:hypothetical protein
MNIDLKNIQKLKYIFILWCLLGLWILWQVCSAAGRSITLNSRVRKALAPQRSAEKDKTPEQSPQEASVPANPFTPPPKFDGIQCNAVLGQEALINGQWYKVGDTAQGAKIVEIQPASVKVLWQEKEHTLVPFNVQVDYSSNANPSTATASPSDQNNTADSSSPENPDRKPPGEFGEDRPRGGFRFSEEQRRQMRERYLNASPEEQAEMRRQARERFGGRRRRRDD